MPDLQNNRRSIWGALVVPSAVGGMALAPAAWWFGPWAATALFGIVLFQALLLGWFVERSRRDASAQLRRPELRTHRDYRPGVYGPLLTEALSRIEELEARADAATRAKTELEARFHVARRRVRHLSGALDGLDDAVLLTDAIGKIFHGNSAAGRICRIGAASVASSEPTLDALPAVSQVVRQILERPAADPRAVEFSADGGAAITSRASIRPIFDDEGLLLGTAVLIADIRAETAEKHRHAEFVSSVCHELKTPMAGIRAYAELLRDGVESDQERAELCGFIESQVERLTRLVDNMLNLARMQSGMIKVRRDDCELNDLLLPAVAAVRQLADEKNLRLVTELSDLFLAVHVDRDLIGQAVINLLSNAVKYTPPEGEIRLRSRLADDRVVVEVKDTGMGIPAESLPRLFERFYRVPRNNAAAAGTGLGLALVKYIAADLHNGSITVQSEIDKGSTFTLTLPFGHRDKLYRRDVTPARRAVASAT